MQVAHLVQKQGAAVGQFEFAPPGSGRPGEGALSWPNNSLSISSVGMAAQFTFTKGPCENGLPS